MAKFSRYDYRYNNDTGRYRTDEEIDQLEREFIKNEQLKQKEMIKGVGGAILAIVLSIFLFASCERIDAGHVGVKVNLYGDGKGVDDVTEVTGWVLCITQFQLKLLSSQLMFNIKNIKLLLKMAK